MKVLLSKILYLLGDLISKIMNTNFTYWLYPIYNQLMKWSFNLDRHGKVWVKRDEHEDFENQRG